MRGPRALVSLLALSLLTASCRASRRAPDAIRISVPYQVEELDPHAKNLASAFAILSHFYDPLVGTDATMAIRPALAAHWDNPDGVTWIFHLRTGVRFHSGRALTADDAVYSIERLRKSHTLGMSDYVSSIASARALSPTKLELKTHRPTITLLNHLRFVAIVPKDSGDDLARSEDGTGPYRLASWLKNERVTMVRNEAYWGEPPELSNVEFKLNRSPDKALYDIQTGESQLVQCNPKRHDAALHALPGVSVFRQSNIFVKFLAFDVAHEKTPFCPEQRNPFRDERVRRAIHLAIDRPRLASRLSAWAVPAWQPVPAFIFGYNPAIGRPMANQEAAKKLLVEAGFPSGFTVTLHARSFFAETAQLAADMLLEIGIKVEVEELGDAAFFDPVKRHERSFLLNRFGCPTGDAGMFFEQVIHSPDVEHHYGGLNDGGISDRALDRQIEENAEMFDGEFRRQSLQQMLAAVTSRALVVPLYVDDDVYALDQRYMWHPRNDSYLFASEIQKRESSRGKP